VIFLEQDIASIFGLFETLVIRDQAQHFGREERRVHEVEKEEGEGGIYTASGLDVIGIKTIGWTFRAMSFRERDFGEGHGLVFALFWRSGHALAGHKFWIQRWAW
jgi:hypothetical protein